MRRVDLDKHSLQTRRRFLRGVLTVAATAGALSTWAQTSPSSTKAAPRSAAKFDAPRALNRALRQPMLAERSTKAFLMLHLGALPSRARPQLEESLKEFERTTREMTSNAPTPDIKDNYQLLDQLFDEFKAIKAKPVNSENAAQLAEQNEELVWIAQKGAMMLQEYSKSTRNDLIATAGDARTLTQRIAKLYLFRAAGIRSAVVADDLKKAETDYRHAVDRLLRASASVPSVKQDLALAETQWLFLKQAIERLNANRTSVVELEHVAKSCDNIAEMMERVAAAYERS
jgi:hypothetical protein